MPYCKQNTINEDFNQLNECMCCVHLVSNYYNECTFVQIHIGMFAIDINHYTLLHRAKDRHLV